MIRSVDHNFKVKRSRGSVIFFMYISCANIEKRKHLQGHLKRTLNHQNIKQKVGECLLS
jgi:hypothetical protein